MATALYAEDEEANGVAAKAKDVFRKHQSQPVDRIVALTILFYGAGEPRLGIESVLQLYSRLGRKEDGAI